MPGMTAWTRLCGVTLALLAAPAMAQSVVEPQVANAPDGADDLPPEASPKVIDRGGLASRGGTAIRSQQSFQERIGTPIYTPIGTAMGVPLQSPRG